MADLDCKIEECKTCDKIKIMKKMLFLLAFSSMSLGMVAQEATTEIPTQKHKVVTNGFWDNWFVDLGGEFISNY